MTLIKHIHLVGDAIFHFFNTVVTDSFEKGMPVSCNMFFQLCIV